MVKHQLPKLESRVRFPSPAFMMKGIEHEMADYILIIAIAFFLGAAVTMFCLLLRKMREDDSKKDDQ